MDREQASRIDITIREMTEGDAADARALMKQLGYDLECEEFRRRYEAVAADHKHVLQVAELDRRLVALLHAYVRPAIDKPPEVVVQALVVDANQRGKGIGVAMMRSAEAWARQQGFSSVSLSSQIRRTDAHAFYEGLGYRIIATSHLFQRECPP
jgi:GNAT superfamily N-acetyltransferase